MQVRVGDEFPVRYRSVDDDRVLIAATVTLTVTDPSGNTSNPAISNPSTGIYEATIEVDEAGFWRYQWVVTAPYDDVDDGAFTAATTVAPDYISLALFKSNLKVTANSHEELMQFAISTASRKVEEHCNRRFWVDPTTTVREYSPMGRTFAVEHLGHPGEKLLVDDIASTSGLVVQVGRGSTWTTIASTEYDSTPDNAIADLKPITGLLRWGSNWTTQATYRIRVTAKHGWPAVPWQVQHATLLQATRLYLRKDSPEGVAGSAEWGAIRMARIDPDVAELLKDLVAYGAGSTG